jgi:hypothetical protein
MFSSREDICLGCDPVGVEAAIVNVCDCAEAAVRPDQTKAGDWTI